MFRFRPRVTLARPLVTALCCVALACPLPAEAARVKRVPTIAVRAGDHKGLSRVLVSWRSDVDYTVDEEPGSLTITFDHAAKADMGDLATQKLRDIQSIMVVDDPDKLILKLAVAPGAKSRDFRAGNLVIIDVLDGPAQPAPTQTPDAAVPSSPTAVPDKPAPAANPAETAIHLMPAQPVSLAAFRRGPYLWVVADGRITPASVTVSGPGAGDLGIATPITGSSGTILRYTLKPGVLAEAHQHGGAWDIVLTTTPPVANPLPVEASLALNTVSVQAQGAAKIITASDPELGDTLKIVPLPAQACFVGHDRHYPDADLLATFQGVAILPHAEDVKIVAESGAVTLGGMALSGDSGLARSDTVLFDLDAWRAGGSDQIVKRRQGIEKAFVTDGGLNEQSEALNIAHLMLANGFGQETLGALDRMVQVQPEVAASPDFIAMRGAANALSVRMPESLADLDSEALKANPEAALWRALALSNGDAGQKQEAFGILSSDVKAIGKYPPELKQRFASALGALAIEKHDAAAIQAALDLITKDPSSPGIDPAILALKASLATAKKLPEADKFYDQLVATRDTKWTALTGFARLEAGLEDKSLSPKDAADKLTSLSYGWRGDDLELQMLAKLAELQLDQGDYKDALGTLHQLAVQAPGTAYAVNAQAHILEAARHAFAASAHPAMTPLEALDLYDSLVTGLPPGTVPDQDVRNLSDRLSDIGMVDKAATLLEPQAKAIADPAAKARLGARIAALRLLDDHPDQALQALKDTEPLPDGKLDENVRIDRHLLEARALAKSGRLDESIAALQGIDTREADAERVDTAWAQHNWALAAEALKRLAGSPPADGKLSPEQASIVLNEAVSLTLAHDTEGLDKVRQTWISAMAKTDKVGAFTLLTSAGSDMTAPSIDAVKASISSLDIFDNFLGTFRKDAKKA